MAKALICDRCGKTYPPTLKRSSLSVISSPICSEERHLDLCPECEHKLFEFIFGKEKNNGKSNNL